MSDPGSNPERVRRAAGAVEILPVPVEGRVFRSSRLVRLGDVGVDGRVRLDALARYLQDVAGDDSADADLGDDFSWVVRRSVIEQHEPLRFRDRAELATFCSGFGSRWAERRVVITGGQRGWVEAVTVWVRVDVTTGRPKPLSDEFRSTYSLAAGGREVGGRLRHDALDVGDPGVHLVPWLPRVADLDVLDHVTNAVAWSMVEEALSSASRRVGSAGWTTLPRRNEVEYRDPIDRRLVVDGPAPVVLVRPGPDRLDVTVRGGEGRGSPVFVTALVTAVQPRGETTRP